MTHSLKEPYLREVSEQTGISVSRAKRTHPIATPQTDRYVKINRNFPTFEQLVNSNAFCFIDYNIFAICLRGALLNNFEKGQGPLAPC